MRFLAIVFSVFVFYRLLVLFRERRLGDVIEASGIGAQLRLLDISEVLRLLGIAEGV